MLQNDLNVTARKNPGGGADYPYAPQGLAVFEELDDFAVAPPRYSRRVAAFPVFKQCDSQWADDVMGENNLTVCAVGCLMSSIATALNALNFGIDGVDVTPGILNAWRRAARCFFRRAAAASRRRGRSAPRDGLTGHLATGSLSPRRLRTHDGYGPGSSNLIEAVISNIVPDMAPAWRLDWPEDGMHTAPDLSPEDVNALLDAGRVVIANVMDGHHFVLVLGADDATVTVRDSGFARDAYNFTDVVGWRLFDVRRATE